MMNTHTDSFPPPPKEFYQAIREAKLAGGYWVRANGSGYSVTWPKRYDPHFRSDDLDVIRAWLRTRIEERYNRIRAKWAAAYYMSARPFPSSQTHNPRRL